MANIDPTFGLNNFKQTKVLSETETLVNNILMVLFGKPGFYPSVPSLGMNIGQYLYKFADDIDLDAIKAELIHQCNEFLPEVDSGELDVTQTMYNGETLLIFKLPVIIDESGISIALGVSVNKKGELVYNFVEGSTTQTI